MSAGPFEEGPLYHYAENEAEVAVSDFVDPAEEAGYLPVDVEYETPTPKTIREASGPAPPRRLSIASSYDAVADYPPVQAPTLPPPRLFPKQKDIEPAEAPTASRSRLSYLGLVGLVGLAGLGGASMGGSSSSSSGALASSASGCVLGTVQWSAIAGSIPGHLVADGSAIDAALYPDISEAIGGFPIAFLPDLMGRYARGGTVPGEAMEASVDASSISVRIDDPGHSHVDSTGFAVKRDGQYSLAHLYTFTTSGLNLKDAGPAITNAETGISAVLEGGTETRPASVVLVPHICVGPAVDPE